MHDKLEFEIYARVCSGKIKQNATVLSTLYCYYKSTGPTTIIAPFKVQVSNLDPLVELFYEVLTESNIEYLKTNSYPRVRKISNEMI